MKTLMLALRGFRDGLLTDEYIRPSTAWKVAGAVCGALLVWYVHRG
jgi:hypothetical protein